MIACKSTSCQLIMYSDGGVVSVGSNDDSDEGGGIGNDDCWNEKADLVLDSLSNLYSELNVFSL